MSNDYGYINARIRALKSFLLKKEDYLEAARQRTPDEFISFLLSRPSYSDDMRKILSLQATRFAPDEALKLNLCRIFRKILKFCDGEPKALILILLTPWDIHNLHTIIRGILSIKNKDEIVASLIPAGRWDLEFLTRLAEAKDLKTLADNLAASTEEILVKEFARLIKKYSQALPLETLENSIIEAYFEKARDKLGQGNNNTKIILDYLSLKVDFFNIVLALKNIGQDAKINFLTGGKVKKEFLQDILQLKSVEDALRNFEQSPYPWLGSEGLNLYKRTQRLSSLERLLRKRFFSFCFNLYLRGDPLSIGIPLAFINFKDNEVNNLRLLSKAIYFGIPKDPLREELIFAG